MSTVPTSGPMIRVDENASGRTASSPPRATTVSSKETRPGAIVREKQPFYELDRWTKYNDLLLVVGFLIVVAGVAFAWRPYSVPVAWVLFGAGVMKLAWMLGKST